LAVPQRKKGFGRGSGRKDFPSKGGKERKPAVKMLEKTIPLEDSGYRSAEIMGGSSLPPMRRVGLYGLRSGLTSTVSAKETVSYI